MLTVKKFGAVLDLSIGGYIAAAIGLLFAFITIVVLPPDIDLAGKLNNFIKSIFLNLN